MLAALVSCVRVSVSERKRDVVKITSEERNATTNPEDHDETKSMFCFSSNVLEIGHLTFLFNASLKLPSPVGDSSNYVRCLEISLRYSIGGVLEENVDLSNHRCV